MQRLKVSGIYMLTWSGTQSFYIGQSIDLHSRERQHLRALVKGAHVNERLQRVYNKYGAPSFFVVTTCEAGSLDRAEQDALDCFGTLENCCNISLTASSSRGTKRSADARAKLSLLHTGTKLSVAHKKSISKGLKAAYNSTRKKPDLKGNKNPFYGKAHTPAALHKMNGRSKNVGVNNSRARLVLNLETGIFYDYVGAAAEACRGKPQYMRRMLNGDRPNKTSFVYV